MNEPVLTTYQFFHACSKVLGYSFLQKLYRRSLRQIYRWGADPAFCEDTEANPLDRLKVIFTRLAEIGREDLALQGLKILAEAIDYDIIPNNKVIPDKQSIEQECLDDYPALTMYHEAIRSNDDLRKIAYLKDKAKIEIEETFIKAKENRKNLGG
jgi:hypothetical protein